MSFYSDSDYAAGAFATPLGAKINFFTADRDTLMQVQGIGVQWADFIISTRKYVLSEQTAREMFQIYPDAGNIDWNRFDWSHIMYPHAASNSDQV